MRTHSPSIVAIPIRRGAGSSSLSRLAGLIVLLVLGVAGAFSPGAAAELIVDAGQSGTSSTGSWCTSGAASPYGASSLQSCGAGGDTYTWQTPILSETGNYDVYVWWTASASRSTAVAYTVFHADGDFTTTRNQQAGGGQWQLLGTFPFTAGSAGTVRVSDANGEASADAVRVVSATGAFTLTVTKAGTGSGLVSSAPHGINCATDCSEVYASGSGVALTAIPLGGSVFAGWSGNADCSDGSVTMTASKTCTATFNGTPVAEIVVNNAGAGTSFTGSWCASTAPRPYGTSSAVSCGSGTDTYRWTPTLPAAGTYEVYAWWTATASRSSQVPYTVVHAAGTFTTTRNQQAGGGQWQLLGTFAFNAGTSSYVEVSDANGPVAADAVRWVTVAGGASATKLAITEVNSGNSPTAGTGFSVVVRAQGAGGQAANVAGATGVTLSLKTGTGALGGTLTGTIPAGASQAIITGVTYTRAESGVALTATRTSGDALTPGDSVAFSVNPGAATALAFTTQPGSSAPGNPIPGPPTVAVRDGQGNTVTSSTASITVALGANPGAGTLSGTTVKSAAGGIASFSNLSIDKSGTGYTLTATSPGLTASTSAGFNELVSLTVTKSGAGTGTVASSPSGISCGADCAENYPLGAMVTLTATPGPGSVFSGWSGDADCSDGVITLSVARTCTATFTPGLIIDNAAAGVQDPAGGRSFTGTWGVSSGANPYGANSLYGTSATTSTYRWTPTITVAGTYAVHVWWTSYSNRSSNVLYTVVHSGGVFTTTRDQQTGGGQWQLLGTFAFSAGTAGYVEVSDANGKTVAADAVRWTLATAPAPTTLTIIDVNGGSSPSAGTGFAVVVRAQDAGGQPANVTAATGVSLSLKTGTGTLGGALTGTIPAGASQTTIAGVTYAKAESGVVLTATRSSGDALTGGDSAAFSVNPGAATTLGFTTQPGRTTPGSTIPGPPTVAIRDSQGNTVMSSSASITVGLGANPGGGTLSGTTVKSAAGGIASFSNLSVSNTGVGYTLTAASPGLSGATSAAFDATTGPSGAAVTYVHDRLGRLVGVVQSDGEAAAYRYDAVGNLLSIARYPSTQTSIIDAPTLSAGVGATVHIRGTGFSTTPGENAVRFNGATAPVVSSTRTELVVTVPATATSGPIVVSTPGGSAASSQPFTVLASGGPPVISTLAPIVASSGSSITVTGMNFAPNAADNRVMVNSSPAVVTAATPTSLTVTVPAATSSGRLSLVAPGGAAVSSDLTIAPFTFPAGSNLQTGRIGSAGGTTVTLGPSSLALTLFDGVAGQSAAVTLSAVSMPGAPVSVLAPDGTTIASTLAASAGNVLSFALPLSGTYTVLVHTFSSIETVAGTGAGGGSGDGGPATSAHLDVPHGVAVDASGNLFVAEWSGRRVRKISPSGIIATVAGGGSGALGDGGPATAATLGLIEAVAVDAKGNVFIADTTNHRIRKVAGNGIITTVAGTGTAGYSGNGGAATSAKLSSPRDVAVDAHGNVYIADTDNHRVRKVSSAGIITVVAGNGTIGSGGDGGSATSAQVGYPFGIGFDSQGNLLIVTQLRIRMVDSTGRISTVAGIGIGGFNGDAQPATSAWLDPMRVAGGAQSAVVISDHYNDRIRKVAADGIITTIAGDGTNGYSGDGGPAVSASLGEPMAIALDGSGNIFVAGRWSNRVRVIRPAPSSGSMTITVTTP
jgi:YD repeat-containing protein